MSDRESLLRLTIDRWLEKATADLHAADVMLQTSIEPWISAFHAQQAAEKYVKALLVARQTHFPKIHDLAKLRALLTGTDPDLVDALAPADVLTPYSVLDRYPSVDAAHPRVISSEEATAAVQLARQVRDEVLARLSPFPESS